MRLIFLVKMVYNMLTLTFNFKVKLGVNRSNNWILVNNYLLLVVGEKFFLINMCSDRTLLTIYNTLTLTFIFKVK